jgi:hypothetical protein
MSIPLQFMSMTEAYAISARLAIFDVRRMIARAGNLIAVTAFEFDTPGICGPRIFARPEHRAGTTGAA